MTDGNGSIALFSIIGVAGMLEWLGSFLLLTGLFVCAVGFTVAGGGRFKIENRFK